ncbi:hypothetical protein GCM10009799_27460 [Nocardiopsis rhodophaea]|uniref:Tox-ART-HYD1 domain-containing protein n=1 Tax=Nocardiopsis rhodophaea TaxID=280238 RepID=A0ABP5EHP1_9ACTN
MPGPLAGGDIVISTESHPFWVPELQEWVDAGDLWPGMWLETSAGTWVQVTATRAWTQSAKVHNLTVEGVHTFNVAVGASSDVLTHNCGGDTPGTLYHYTNQAGHDGILSSGKMYPSWKANNPKDARYGDG